MRKNHRLLGLFIFLFLLILTSCDSTFRNDIDAYYNIQGPWDTKEFIGFETENKPLESHNFKIYYGLPGSVLQEFFDDYDLISLFTDFDHDVRFRIERRIYEDTRDSKTEYLSKEVYSEINKLSYFISYDFLYGLNCVNDVIGMEDIYINTSGYGIISYIWYLEEIDGSSIKICNVSTWNRSTLGKFYSYNRMEKEASIYYTVTDDKIVFKVRKEVYYC